MPEVISIEGARVHNLKNVSVDIPHKKLVVITGLSGSGKSSLAFDTIYAEGQRRYVESLSSYAKQFLHIMDKPDVDRIEGLTPVIAINQQSFIRTPRSTVATMTEIYDYTRLLFARVGVAHCPEGHGALTHARIPDIIDRIEAFYPRKASQQCRIGIALNVPKANKERLFLDQLKKMDLRWIAVDDQLVPVDEIRAKTLSPSSTIMGIVDIVDVHDREKLTAALRRAMDVGGGLASIHFEDGRTPMSVSEQFMCPVCGFVLSGLDPRMFSFNTPHGACSRCGGLGTRSVIDPDLVIPNDRLTLDQGAIRPFARLMPNQRVALEPIERIGARYGFTLDTPIHRIAPEALRIILHGEGEAAQGGYPGVLATLYQKYQQTDSEYVRSEIERTMRVYPCDVCGGLRLNPVARAVRVGSDSICDVMKLSIANAWEWFSTLSDRMNRQGNQWSKTDKAIAQPIIRETTHRLAALKDIGLEYLTLDRSSVTLAGGEAQRVRLATQLAAPLVGLTYVLDEPSIGLHHRDNNKLIQTLEKLRDHGNTVIVVEHDEEMIRAADIVIDIGPGAGQHGGLLVAMGRPETLKGAQSHTAHMLSGSLTIDHPAQWRKGNGHALSIIGAKENNLRDITVRIPLGVFVAVTGVSGSGKSTLVEDILSKSLHQTFYRAKDAPGAHEGIEGMEHLDKVISIDQSPIGRTPRSNPATYTGLFTGIRDLFIDVPEAKAKRFKAGHFSFNVKGGRCEHCQGGGMKTVEMQFLPEVYVECEGCLGRRYTDEVLSVRWRGRNIADVLDMTVEEALQFFEASAHAALPSVVDKLEILHRVGLGYVKLGQSATTLSGGEAQRIKLATELSRRSTGKTLYILDEPTSGLHLGDVRQLLRVLNELVDKGNTVLVIEHHMDVIKSVDWVIDLGPEGGNKGGELVAEGTPMDVARVARSLTGQALKRFFSTPSKNKFKTNVSRRQRVAVAA